MPSFSFIHTADFHLDSPFSAMGRNDETLAATLRSATFEAFDRVIELCLEKAVDFLLVAGDAYDGEDRSLRAQIRFRDGLKRLSDARIQTLVVHGNHDPLHTWSSTLEWPPGVHIFGERIETVPVERDGALLARVQGISYAKRDEKRNLARLFGPVDHSFHIGLLHTNVGSDTGHEPYAPCSLGDLRATGMDYWALGHVHNRKVLSEGSPVILYPGNTQGRSIRESGERGCYLVRVDGTGETSLEFFPTDTIRWINGEIPIDALQSEQDLAAALDRTCSDIAGGAAGRPVVSRIAFRGKGSLHRFLRRPDAEADILEMVRETGMARDPFVWVEKVVVDVAPSMDLEAWAGKGDFLGELLRYARELAAAPDLEERVSRELAPLFDNARARRFTSLPDARTMRSLLRAAERLCAERLSGGEEID